MDLDRLKIMVLQALFLNDILSELLVLKGGTALTFLDALGRRSIDVDFSLFEISKQYSSGELNDLFQKALKDHFINQGLYIFYYDFEEKGKEHGGFQIRFKFLPYEQYQVLILEKNGDKKCHQGFKDLMGFDHVIIQVSKNEFCKPHVRHTLDDVTVINIYTPEMIVFEKLRALCQQMDEYMPRVCKTARSRDLFDIYILNEKYQIIDDELDESKLEILKNIFEIKKVDIRLLSMLEKYRDYHREDFKSLESTIFNTKKLGKYDFYFDYVIRISNIILSKI